MAVYKFVIEVPDDHIQEFVQRIAALLLFTRVKASGSVIGDGSPLAFTSDEEYVDPVLATEAEEVREQLRPILQKHAEVHGVQLTKDLMKTFGTEGIRAADQSALAQLRHFFKVRYKGGEWWQTEQTEQKESTAESAPAAPSDG